jgi:hypothetical protein
MIIETQAGIKVEVCGTLIKDPTSEEFVEEYEPCEKCAFNHDSNACRAANCLPWERQDKRSVYFKLVE